MSKRRITIGSLFSGSGGFELAGAMFGAVPVWASEIEPFPIAVTRKRFPEMIHMGDIGKLDGAELPPVDIITGGSPCQDMSVAGKREGLDGARSGLFREQIRIIREMRQKHEKPRYMVWENVPGAFSSNKGADFLVAQAPEYIVRRLTPLECCRLQGFPDGWTDGLGTENPDKETVEFWESVFEEHRRLTGSPKNRRSRNQVIKWIRDPYSDTALYRMWGNGISLPCAAFVMKGIVMELSE